MPEPREAAVSRTPQEIFESYVYTGTVTRNADALAENFTADGVFETARLRDYFAPEPMS
ncbi:hypothetical protein GCM10010341_75240 [Streptomyces noursei]|nr:hypothetical protein GCM10010341_75240 [Streptomyces noursei]